MANSHRRGCNCNCNCNRPSYGVLNTIPQRTGYHHHHCGVTYPCCPCNYPYYTGPCAPGSVYDSPDYPMPCGTGTCHNGCLPVCTGGGWYPESIAPTYGMFSANLPIATAAGAAIPLLVSGENSGDFEVSGGAITIPEDGVYLAIFSFNVPDNVTLNTSMSLALNGGTLPASVTPVEATTDSDPMTNHIGFSIFKANENATLTLNSTAPIALETRAGAQNTFTLALYKLG